MSLGFFLLHHDIVHDYLHKKTQGTKVDEKKQKQTQLCEGRKVLNLAHSFYIVYNACIRNL